jgi:hypothetical protein
LEIIGVIEIMSRKSNLPKPFNGCQDNRSKNPNLNCIYRIFYKNAKKTNPKNEICLSDI